MALRIDYGTGGVIDDRGGTTLPTMAVNVVGIEAFSRFGNVCDDPVRGSKKQKGPLRTANSIPRE